MFDRRRAAEQQNGILGTSLYKQAIPTGFRKRPGQQNLCSTRKVVGNDEALKMCPRRLLPSFRRDNSFGFYSISERVMKRLLAYLIVLIVFGLGIGLTLQQGRKLLAPRSAVQNLEPKASHEISGTDPSGSLLANLRENSQDPLTRLF